MNIIIVPELKDACLEYEKNQHRGSSFRPYKYNKHKEGVDSPVFFIGSPGVSVAIYATAMIAVTFYLFSLPFMWWLWLLYGVLGAFFLKVSFKLDKVKQIRGYTLALSLSAIRLIEILNKEEKSNIEIDDLLNKSKDFLLEALKWVEDSLISHQLEVLELELEKIKLL